MPRAVGINHIALEVGSIDEALAFYGGLFELELRGRVPGMAFVDLGDQFIALAERSEREPDRARHFGLVVDDRDAVLAAAREAGVVIFGGNSFLDPWGNHVQVVAYAEIQFTKAPEILRGMGLELEKSESALRELPREGTRLTELSHHDLVSLLVLLTAGAAMLVLVPKLRIPYPILLVLGGLALGFVPGLPEIDLPPELVLVGILPPLLYGAAFFTSLRDLRANLRPVGLLAVGLVLLTMVVVAVVAHEIVPGLPWAAAFVLGAVVSPTDPIAATAIMQRLGVPRRIVSIVEGESLVNDGTALVAYRAAVVATVTGVFSLWEAGVSFVFNVAGGVVVGLGVAWIVRQVRRRLDYPPAEVTISLLTGYFAYIPAELMGVSAVIAAVTAGIYLGWYTPELTTPEVRLMGESAWEIVTFTLNAILFTLIGLQLPGILDELDAYSAGDLLWWAVAIWLTVLAVRALWIYPAAKLPRVLVPRIRERDPMPSPAALALITWSGMRGGVSLAAALAIPLATDTGAAFPGRDVILFLTFAVIFGTLVIQGLTLPAVIRLLDLEDDGEDDLREEARARIHAAGAALLRLDELLDEDWVREDTATRIRGSYGFRRDRFSARLDGADDGSIEARSQDFQRLRRELLNAERAAVQQLRRSGEISDEVARRVERDLDLEDARLEI